MFQKSKKATNSRGRFTGRGHGMIELGIKFHDSLMFDGDCRKLVRMLQDSLAEHYSESLLDGVDPETGRSLPGLSPRTKAISKGRSGGFGVRSGETARTWQVGVVNGNVLSAKGKVFPSKDPAVRRLFSMWLDRSPPVDLQSVDGNAEEVIKETVQAWMEASIGDGVATPRRVDMNGRAFKKGSK